LARREAAIVSPYAGTTRDVIEVHLDLGGYPVTLLDTAGIRESDDPVEQEGMRRAQARAAAADLVLWLIDAGDKDESNDRKLSTSNKNYLIILNKIDVLTSKGEAARRAGELQSHGRRAFLVSGKTGAGIENLVEGLAEYAEQTLGGTAPILVTRQRHRVALQQTADALRRAVTEGSGRDDIVAEELRLAARSLGRLTGLVDVEDVLDVIFRDFCIGK
jgi:tRNA modification GTPase